MLTAADSMASAICRAFLKSRSASPNNRRWPNLLHHKLTGPSDFLPGSTGQLAAHQPSFDQNHSFWPDCSVRLQSHLLIVPSSCTQNRSCTVPNCVWFRFIMRLYQLAQFNVRQVSRRTWRCQAAVQSITISFGTHCC